MKILAPLEMGQYKNIIFDLGGVIMNIDYDLTVKAFENLGVANFDKIFNQRNQSHLARDFEIGKISAALFREQLKLQLSLNISDDDFDLAWNAMLLDLPKDRLELVQSLRKKYKIYLFSNTNEIHLKEGYRICKRDTDLDSFAGFFDAEYYSHLLGKQKPNPESFQAIIDENNLVAEETLFVDDSIQHVEGAKTIGLQTVHLTKDKSIFDVFMKEGL